MMELADETTLNLSETMMAICRLRRTLPRRLLGGESVKLGNWGSFSVTPSSLGVSAKEEVNVRDIRNVNLSSQPDEVFETGFQRATFAWVGRLAEGRPDGSGSSDSEPPGEMQTRMIATSRYPDRHSRVSAQIPAFCRPDTSEYPYGYVPAFTYLCSCIYASAPSYPYGYTDTDMQMQEYSRTDTSRKDAGRIDNRGRGVGIAPTGLWLTMRLKIIIFIE